MNGRKKMNIRSILLFLFVFFHSLVAFCSIDLTDYNALLTDSKKILSVAVEGINLGEYRTGSKAAFENDINKFDVRASLCNTSLQLDSVMDQLHDSYLNFLRQRYGIQRPLVSDNCWNISTDTSRWGSFNVHDPTIIKTKGYFYVYGTDVAWGQPLVGIPYRRSRDLVHWEYLGKAFNGYPPKNNFWADSISGVSGHTQWALWAPYIMKVGAEYRLYYTAVHTPQFEDICLAVASHPRGPWVQRGSVYNSPNAIDCNSIDPSVIIGKDGRFWLTCGSWHSGIYSMELNPKTGLRKVGTSPTIVAKNRISGWSSMEGPEIIYNPDFDLYYLFVAEGDLSNIYHTRVARSVNPNGPFRDYFGNSVVYSVKNDIYPLVSYPYKFNNHQGWQGVAHCAILNDNGTYFMLNQGRPTDFSSMMDMHVKKIYWTNDGWPTISPERFANPGIMPAITPELLVGTWEEILLNEMKIGGFSVDVPADGTTPASFLCASKTLTLKSDGSISPGGSWSYNGQYLSITKDGSTFAVTPDWEWDWENGCPTLIFTGLRPDGRSYWGKKSLYLDRQEINLVYNSTFDLGLQGYSTFAYSGKVVLSISGKSSNSLGYIHDKTFNADVSSKSTYFWDQSLSWRFPAQQGSRYKVSFNYQVSDDTPLHVEVQEASKNLTPVYRNTFQLSGSGKIEFLTYDVAITDAFYTLNIQYGDATVGVNIQLDDISVIDITNQWDGNFLVNGGFEYDFDSWTSKFTNSSISCAVVDTPLISGNKSLSVLQNTSSITDRFNNRVFWKTYLPVGWKYRVSFDVKGSGKLDAFLRSSTASTSVIDLAGLYGATLTGQVQKFFFDVPVIRSAEELSLCFSPKNEGRWLLDNVKLEIVHDTVTNLLNPQIKSNSPIGIYPNPTTGFLHISSGFEGNVLEIIDLRGQILYSERISTKLIYLPKIPNGIYVARIVTSKGVYSESLLVK